MKMEDDLISRKREIKENGAFSLNLVQLNGSDNILQDIPCVFIFL